MDTITGDLFEFCAITNAAREAVNRTTGGTDAEDLLKAGWKLAFADKSYKCMRDIIRFQVSVRDQAGEEQVLVVKLKQNDPNKKPARKNPKPYYTYGVDREDGSQRPYQRLWDFAYVSDSAYKQLMDLALPEPWSFTDRDGGHEILSWYLNGTFLHLLDEEKIRYGQDAQGKFAVFCTGLVNRNFEDIYCFCEPNSKAKAEWIVKSFCTKGSGNAGKRLVRAFGTDMPQRAVYYRTLTDVVYDGSFELVPDFEHLMLRWNRVEPSALRVLFAGSAEAAPLIDEAERESDPKKRQELLEPLKGIVDGDERLRRSLWRALSDACELAQTRARYMFSSAIPSWNPKRSKGGEVFFCLPLSLVDVDRVDAVLVARRIEVQRDGAPYCYYEGETIYSLQMAYEHARTLQRVDGLMGWIESAFPSVAAEGSITPAGGDSAFSSTIAPSMTPQLGNDDEQDDPSSRLARLAPEDPAMGTYVVRPGDVIGVARRSSDPAPDIVLPSIRTFKYVSQRHGTFTCAGGTWSYEQHDVNGTKVRHLDGSVQKLAKGSKTELASGDELSFAESAWMKFMV
ncbi:MAG TPA: DUF3825 domain-containing protein [Enorma massiliensis]|uniref:DUF3825 domain-containing protein n=1 Tax=Enorma massiliensis TaxID=1472761 RepID=UPI001DB62FBD|nr:DUF3825 domain-containing protein [Enorma massiliensis]HJG62090.1 DUF3825 domain-containing protein [Enorma massiliensis]